MKDVNDIEDVFTLGTWLGRQQAFGLIAGRCSVAEMECLIAIYENKLYLKLEPTWDDYCRRRLGCGRRTAERLMQTFRQQGPKVAKLNCFARIRPKEYQTFDAVLTEEGLSFRGEIIALEPENAPRLAEAVEAIRKESAAQSEPVDPVAQAIARVTRSLHATVSEFSRIQAMNLEPDAQAKLMALLVGGRDELDRIRASAEA